MLSESSRNCFSLDVVFEASSYRRDASIASGLKEMSDIFDCMTRTFSCMDYEVKRFIPAVDPDLIIVEVSGDNEVASNENRYRNDYLFLIQCRDDKITRIFEYSKRVVSSSAVTPS